MMSQKNFFFLSDEASLREDVVQLPYFLLILAMLRGSNENQPNGKYVFHSHMPALEGELDITLLSHNRMCFSQLECGLTFPISLC